MNNNNNMLPVKSFTVSLENWLELGMEHSCRALWEKVDLKAQHWGGGGAMVGPGN